MRRAVVIGDSAMWGQGLAQNDKYAFRFVRQSDIDGEEIHLSPKDFIPHSGAIIGDLSTLEARNSEGNMAELGLSEESDFDLFAWEVPTDYPSIYKQVTDIDDPNSVDLVIMNGGINDIGMASAVEPDRDTFVRDVHRNIIQVTNTRLPLLLEHANKTFRNADIIYVGYYPALGPKSNIPPQLYQFILGAYLMLFGFLVGVVAFIITNFKIEDVKKQAFELYELFSLMTIKAIARFNVQNNAHIVYCSSGFGEENAIYGSGEQFVFKPFDNNNTTVQKGRIKYCAAAYNVNSENVENKMMGFSWEDADEEELPFSFCTQAYLLHPNETGARQYAAQLKKIATPALNFSYRDTLKDILKEGMSIKKVNSIFTDFKPRTVRQLSNIRWINSVMVDLDLNLITANTDFKFPEEMMFDFGWGKSVIKIPYKGSGTLFTKLGMVNVKGDVPMSKLSVIKLFLPKFRSFLKFKLSLIFYVNGHHFGTHNIDELSFAEQSGQMIWEVPLY